MSAFNVFEKDRREIDGPVNVMRLEGQVDGVAKIVYLFMDHHLPPDQQTECLNVYAQDVNKYFAQTFRELNGRAVFFDFFVETDAWTTRIDPAKRDTMIKEAGGSVFRDIYLRRVRALLISAIEYDPVTKRTLPSKIFQNIRLHYLDIREELERVSEPIRWFREEIWNMMCSRRTDLDPAIDALGHAKRTIEEIIKVYEGITADPKSIDPTYPLFTHSVRKLLYGYNHKSVQKQLTKLFREQLSKFQLLPKDIDALIQNYTSMQNTLDKPPITPKHGWDKYFIDEADIGLTIMHDAYIQALEFDDRVRIIVAWFTDCYLLRRVLDKDYITNAIIYCGAAHAVNYAQVLVSDFGFKITHLTYSTVNSIPKLNAEIVARVSKGESIDELISPSLSAPQCSDITDFPKDFS